jgi:hypothetical protein
MKDEWHEYTVCFENGKQMILNIRKDQSERREVQTIARRWASAHNTKVVSLKCTE